MMSTSTRGRWADEIDVDSDSDSSSAYSWLSGGATTSSETGFKKQTILQAVRKAMAKSPNHDAFSEDDTSVGTPRSETGFEKQTIALLQQSMSDSSDDETSQSLRSGACTLVLSDICTLSSTNSSKRCLRNMSLTREHLLKLQQRPAVQEDPSTEDVSSLARNAVVSSKADMNMAQENFPDFSSEITESGSLCEPVSQWTVGSDAHESGSCKPCLFYISSTGCLTGPDCRFCHLSHTRAIFPRPSKSKRDRIKKMLSTQGGI